MTATPNSRNQAAYRKRQADKGLVLVRVWVPPLDAWKIKSLAEELQIAARMKGQK